MSIRKHKHGYDVWGYGHPEGTLYNLTKDELNQLLVDISCQNINDEFDEFGEALKQLDKTIGGGHENR